MDPDLTAQFIADVSAEWSRLTANQSALRSVMEKELIQVTRNINGGVAAKIAGMRGERLQEQVWGNPS